MPDDRRGLDKLDAESVQAAADRFDLGTVVRWAPLAGGSVGNVFGLTTVAGRFVLRACIPPLDPDALQRERYFARAVHERSSLAAPWPYLIDPSSEIFSWPYAITPHLPGRTLHYQMDLEWRGVGAALGRAVAELDEVAWPAVGEWDAASDDIVPVDATPADWLLERVEALERRVAETSEPLDAASLAYVDDAVRAALPLIGEFPPTYVHGDLGIGNFVAEDTDDAVAFTGVFDLGEGYCADPDENVAGLWWPLYWGRAGAAAGFLEGHRAVRPPRPGQDERLRAYDVFGMLKNWETGRRERFPWYGSARTFREWSEPLLTQVEEVLRMVGSRP
jgi:Ser/Thr protein kinase RdoA (MazF antagonist)